MRMDLGIFVCMYVHMGRKLVPGNSDALNADLYVYAHMRVRIYTCV